MYYSNTPRHQWTALDILEEEMDPTPPQIYPLRQKIEQWKVDLEQWDIFFKNWTWTTKQLKLRKILLNGISDHWNMK